MKIFELITLHEVIRDDFYLSATKISEIGEFIFCNLGLLLRNNGCVFL